MIFYRRTPFRYKHSKVDHKLNLLNYQNKIDFSNIKLNERAKRRL